MIPLGWIGIALYILVNAIAVKKKNLKLMGVSSVVLAAFMFLVAPLRSITEQGRYVVVENKFGGRARLEKLGPSVAKVYLMTGQAERPWGISGYSVKIPVLPMGTVDDLNKMYGDFRKCESPAKAEIANQIVELRLVGTDLIQQIRNLETAFSQSFEKGEELFIHVKAVNLVVLENKMQGRGGDRGTVNAQENIWVQDFNFFSQKSK